MSGYQESLVRMGSLAEAAGVLKAFEEYDNPCLCMACVERAVRDVSTESPSELGDFLSLPRVPLKTGTNYVVICGDRHPYQFCSGRWFYLDGLADEVHDDYGSYLKQVDPEEVRAAWDDDPAIAQRSYVNWKDYLACVEKTWDEGEVDPRSRFSEVVYGINVKPPLWKGIDPDPIYAIAAMLRERGITGGIINGKIPADDLFG